MNIGQLERRFLDDAQFHALVMQLVETMEAVNIQPYEVRDAAFLAELIFRERHAEPLIRGQWALPAHPKAKDWK